MKNPVDFEDFAIVARIEPETWVEKFHEVIFKPINIRGTMMAVLREEIIQTICATRKADDDMITALYLVSSFQKGRQYDY